MSTWEEIGDMWNRAQQMGYQAVQAAMDVGDELTQKKLETPHGEWVPKITEVFNSNQTRVSDLEPMTTAAAQKQANRLMRLALHRELIEEHHPESQRSALALLPKAHTKTSKKQLQAMQEEIDKYESFAKKTAKEQAKVLALQMVKRETKRIQTEAAESFTLEIKALKGQLHKERQKVLGLMREADEKRQFYQDLLNKRANGHNFRHALKILKQVAHPDRSETSHSLRTKAMSEIQFIEKFLGV